MSSTFLLLPRSFKVTFLIQAGDVGTQNNTLKFPDITEKITVSTDLCIDFMGRKWGVQV